MATLKITGSAECEYEYDWEEISVGFRAQSNSSAEALKKVTSQCEKFLSVLAEKGVSTDNIRIGTDQAVQSYGRDRKSIEATREVIIRIPFDIKFTNYLMSLLSEHDFDVTFDTSYEYSKIDKLSQVLLAQAFEDSRHKAELIAEATHQKITGIESVVANDSNALAGELVYSEHEIDFNSDNNALSYSNSLKNPKATADMDIDVVWIME